MLAREILCRSVPFGYRNGTLACMRVTDAFRYILALHGIFVFNYIDNLIGLAPDSVADFHFQFTLFFSIHLVLL
jgi:hypothetical protein